MDKSAAKSVMGVERLVIWRVISDTPSGIEYDDPIEFEKELKQAGYTPSMQSSSNFADNIEIENAATKNGGTLNIELADMRPDEEAVILGCKLDDNLITSNKDDVVPYVCVAYSYTYNDGTVDLYKFPKVKFTEQGKSASTMKDSGVEFQSTNIQGKYMATQANGDEKYTKKYVSKTEMAEFIEQWFTDAKFKAE